MYNDDDAMAKTQRDNDGNDTVVLLLVFDSLLR